VPIQLVDRPGDDDRFYERLDALRVVAFHHHADRHGAPRNAERFREYLHELGVGRTVYRRIQAHHQRRVAPAGQPRSRLSRRHADVMTMPRSMTNSGHVRPPIYFGRRGASDTVTISEKY
jgi:hypothetical protein